MFPARPLFNVLINAIGVPSFDSPISNFRGRIQIIGYRLGLLPREGHDLPFRNHDRLTRYDWGLSVIKDLSKLLSYPPRCVNPELFTGARTALWK